ncbi:hypothetical protein NBRC10513_000923 [Rhodotorula toruloides]
MPPRRLGSTAGRDNPPPRPPKRPPPLVKKSSPPPPGSSAYPTEFPLARDPSDERQRETPEVLVLGSSSPVAPVWVKANGHNETASSPGDDGKSAKKQDDALKGDVAGVVADLVLSSGSDSDEQPVSGKLSTRQKKNARAKRKLEEAKAKAQEEASAARVPRVSKRKRSKEQSDSEVEDKPTRKVQKKRERNLKKRTREESPTATDASDQEDAALSHKQKRKARHVANPRPARRSGRRSRDVTSASESEYAPSESEKPVDSSGSIQAAPSVAVYSDYARLSRFLCPPPSVDSLAPPVLSAPLEPLPVTAALPHGDESTAAANASTTSTTFDTPEHVQSFELGAVADPTTATEPVEPGPAGTGQATPVPPFSPPAPDAVVSSHPFPPSSFRTAPDGDCMFNSIVASTLCVGPGRVFETVKAAARFLRTKATELLRNAWGDCTTATCTITATDRWETAWSPSQPISILEAASILDREGRFGGHTQAVLVATLLQTPVVILREYWDSEDGLRCLQREVILPESSVDPANFLERQYLRDDFTPGRPVTVLHDNALHFFAQTSELVAPWTSVVARHPHMTTYPGRLFQPDVAFSLYQTGDLLDITELLVAAAQAPPLPPRHLPSGATGAPGSASGDAQATTAVSNTPADTSLYDAMDAVSLMRLVVRPDLPTAQRLAAADALARQAATTDGVLSVQLDVGLPPLDSALVGKAQPEDGAHVVAVDEASETSARAGRHGQTVIASLDNGTEVAATIEADGRATVVERDSGSTPSAAPAQNGSSDAGPRSMTVAEARAIVEGLDVQWPAEVKLRKGPLVGKDYIDIAKINCGQRPPLDPVARRNVLAAIIVYDDLAGAQGQRTARAKFEPQKSLLLREDEKKSKAAERILDNLISSAAVIIARSACIYAAPVPGLAPWKLKDAGIDSSGTNLDFDLLRQVIPPGSIATDAFARLESCMSKQKGADYQRSGSRKLLSLSVSEALDRVAVGESDKAFWHPRQPERPDRSPEAIYRHPAFKPVLDIMRTELDSAARRYAEQGIDAPEIAKIMINPSAHQGYREALFDAIKKSQHPFEGFPPVTTGINVEDELPDFRGSFRTEIWKGFLAQFHEDYTKPLIKKYLATTSSASTNAKSIFRLQRQGAGLLKISHSTDRSSGKSTALEDGSFLAHATHWFEVANRAILDPTLAALHEDINGKDRKFEPTTTAEELVSQAEKILLSLRIHLVQPIVDFADSLPGLPVFEQGHLLIVRPATDDHGGLARTKLGGGSAVDSDNHLVRFELTEMPLRTLDASDASQLLEAALEQNMKPTSEPDQGASVLDASTRSSFFDTFLPFSPVRTIHAQAGAVAQDIARAREMQEDFRAVIDLLASGATSLTAAKAFGHSFNGRQGLDSIFMLRDALQIMHDEQLVQADELQRVFQTSLVALALAVISPRPASYFFVVTALVSSLGSVDDDPVRLDRLETILGQVQQQYATALLSLVHHSDVDVSSLLVILFARADVYSSQRATVHGKQQVAKGTFARVQSFSVLFDLICRHGRCYSCGKATYAFEEYFPTTNGDASDRTLSWTTTGAARHVVAAVWTKELIDGLYGGEAPSKAMMGCVADIECQASSWAARAVHKGMTGLTHKTDKYGRGRKTAMKMALQQALGQVKEARAEEGGERQMEGGERQMEGGER